MIVVALALTTKPIANMAGGQHQSRSSNHWFTWDLVKPVKASLSFTSSLLLTTEFTVRYS
jgi:hypothetical protein